MIDAEHYVDMASARSNGWLSEPPLSQARRGPPLARGPGRAVFAAAAGVASMGDTKGGPFDVSGDQARVWASACRRTRTVGPTHRQITQDVFGKSTVAVRRPPSRIERSGGVAILG